MCVFFSFVVNLFRLFCQIQWKIDEVKSRNRKRHIYFWERATVKLKNKHLNWKQNEEKKDSVQTCLTAFIHSFVNTHTQYNFVRERNNSQKESEHCEHKRYRTSRNFKEFPNYKVNTFLNKIPSVCVCISVGACIFFVCFKKTLDMIK